MAYFPSNYLYDKYCRIIKLNKLKEQLCKFNIVLDMEIACSSHHRPLLLYH